MEEPSTPEQFSGRVAEVVTSPSSTGDSTRIALELGEPIPVEEAADLAVPDGCGLSPQRSLAVPYRLTVTVVSSFDIPYWLVSSDVGSGWLSDTPRSDGGMCNGSEFSYAFNNLAAGQAEVRTGYFVAADYYSPNFPEGNPQVAKSGLINLSSADTWTGSAVCPGRIQFIAGPC